MARAEEGLEAFCDLAGRANVHEPGIILGQEFGD